MAVATERARRPDSFTQAAKEAVAARDVCPFCPGHESMTPPEVLAYRAPGSPANGEGWWIRVVPNLYAAFRLEADGQERREGRFSQRDAIGACEVLISSPDHRAPTPLLPRRQVEEIVQSYVDRYRHHAQNPALEHVLILYNHGRPAGASLEHPHSQLYAINLVPPTFNDELGGARRFLDAQAGCAFCRTMEDERAAGSRIVFENDAFVVFAPFAARTPFETWIMPRRHRASFGELDLSSEKAAFAEALQLTLTALHEGLKLLDKTVRQHEKEQDEHAKANGKRAAPDRKTKALQVACRTAGPAEHGYRHGSQIDARNGFDQFGIAPIPSAKLHLICRLLKKLE